ncbi:hypothetical protein BC833DRAFT_585537, partial [Globomyces pollinis-pini]
MIRLSSLLIYQLVKSVVVQSQWNISDCYGPPDTILYFQPQETITVLYNTFEIASNSKVCGTNPILMNDGCCKNSLDTQTNGQSAYFYSGDKDAGIPISANGYKYCLIKALSETSLNRFERKYVLEGEKCVDGVICNQSGYIKIHKTIDCSDTGEIQPITESSLRWDSIAYGPIAISHIQIDDGSHTLKWSSYIPARLIAPRFDDPLDYIAIICYLFALFFSIRVSLHYILLHAFTENAQYVEISVQLMWQIWLLLNFFLWIMAFNQQWHELLLDECQGVLFNVLSMASVHHLIHPLLEYVQIKSILKRRLVYVSIYFIHIILSGGNYAIVFKYVGITQLELFQFQWVYIYPFWNIFSYSLNTFSPAYIAYKLVLEYQDKKGLDTWYRSKKELSRKFPTFIRQLYFQNFNTFLYLVLSVAVSYSQVMGSDHRWKAMNAPLCLVNIIHEVVHIYISDMVEKILHFTRQTGKLSSREVVKQRIRSSFSAQGSKGPSNNGSKISTPRMSVVRHTGKVYPIDDILDQPRKSLTVPSYQISPSPCRPESIIVVPESHSLPLTPKGTIENMNEHSLSFKISHSTPNSLTQNEAPSATSKPQSRLRSRSSVARFSPSTIDLNSNDATGEMLKPSTSSTLTPTMSITTPKSPRSVKLSPM